MQLKKGDKLLLLLLAFLLGVFALVSAFRPDGNGVSSPAQLQVVTPPDSLHASGVDTLSSQSPKDHPSPAARNILTTERYPGPPSWMASQGTMVHKMSKGETLDLNKADTIELQRLPGVGPAFARRIFRYRERLGGYYTKEQLQEVYGMDRERYERLQPFVVIRTRPRTLYISSDSITPHPYLSYRQSDYLKYHLSKGDSLTWKLLRSSGAFTRDDSLRLSPYLPIR